MDFDFTPEQQAWRETFERFIGRHAPPEYVRRLDAERRYPEEIWDLVAAEGWLGLLLPEELGGVAAGAVVFAIFSEVMGRRGVAFAEAFSVPMFTATNIARYGTAEQKRQHLEPFMAGRLRFAIAITEPDAGSDAAALKLRATRTEGGWRLNGQKVFISGAHLPSTVLVVAARTQTDAPKHEGISLFLVPNDAPGLEIRRLPTLSRRPLGTNEVFFTDVQVGDGQLLGERNRGWTYLTGHLELERVSIAASYLGAAYSALEAAKSYARQRKQFGRYIAEFQSIRHLLAQLQTEWDAAWLLTYRVASHVDKGRRCIGQAAMAKLFAADVSMRVAREAMVIFGGYGQLPEYDVERHYREAIQNLIGGGTPQIQRSIIAREMGL